VTDLSGWVLRCLKKFDVVDPASFILHVAVHLPPLFGKLLKPKLMAKGTTPGGLCVTIVNAFFGNTLFEGVCIRLTSRHKHDITPVMNMSLWMFMTFVIKCHSVNYDTSTAKLTLFKMSLLWQLDINQDKNVLITWH